MSSQAGIAVEISRRGGPERLRNARRVFPSPGPGEIRLKLEFAGVAMGDVMLREGLVASLRAGHVVPGYDAIGFVDAVGAHVSGIGVGDRVAVWTGGQNGYASSVIASAELAVIVPPTVAPQAAATLTLNYATAWQMATRIAAVGRDSKVLVHGASGGVGSALVDIISLRGAQVIGTTAAGRLENLEERGVRALDRRGEWAEAVRKIAPRGVDAVFDGSGGRTGRQSVQLLAAGGKLVTYGASAALKGGRRSVVGLIRTAVVSPRISALRSFARGIGFDGYISTSYIASHPQRFREDLAELFRLLEAGVLHPRVGAILPLESAAEAHSVFGSGIDGKVLLTAEGQP